MKYQINIRTVSKFAKRRLKRKTNLEWRFKIKLMNAELQADIATMETRRMLNIFPRQTLDIHPDSGV